MSAAKAKDGGFRRWWALILLCVAQFVDVLDINAVIVALPTIGGELGFAAGDLQWVVTAYALFFGGFLILAGRVADLFGRRRMFVVGLALFSASSLLCGLAPSPLALVAFRAAQGLGAAFLAPAALAIISTTFPEGRERNFAMGVWTAVAAGGGAAGLVLGGLITDVLGWEWIFFVNVPLGAAGVALTFVLLEADRGERTSRRLDLPGAVTVTAGLVLLVYGLTRAEGSGFGSPLTLATIVLALALLAAFLFVEHSVADPLIPLRVFRVWDLSGSALVAFANTATTSPVGIIAAIYLQEVLAYSPTLAGLLGLPSTLSGLALGCSAVASTTRGTSAVREEERGLASGLLTSSAQVGTALGLAIFFAVAVTRTEAVAIGTEPSAEALVVGYRWAFFVGAGIAARGAVAALRLVGRDARHEVDSSGELSGGKG